jgi:RNA-directed DNA polymerase
MEMERRASVGYSVKCIFKQLCIKQRMMREEMTKSLPVSKRMVYESYLKVVSKQGGAGIDRESIEKFNENMNKNLYKIWNRMTSGSYFPPSVRTVFIPKKQGGVRPLGIPTVSDHIHKV